MKSIAWNLVGLAALVCAFVLLPSTSHAGSISVDAQFVAINTGPSKADTANCTTLVPCTLSPDPTTGMGSQPAIAFDLITDQTVHIEADVFDGLGCASSLGTAMGDLPLAAGHIVIYPNFQPPLPDGSMIS